jgi:hypothetical protein
MWTVLVTWDETDAVLGTVTVARRSVHETSTEADARYTELRDLIEHQNWRPNLRAFAIQVDRPEPIRQRVA